MEKKPAQECGEEEKKITGEWDKERNTQDATQPEIIQKKCMNIQMGL